jgi:hypothetical protein
MMKQTAFLVIVLGALAAPQAAKAGAKEEAREHYDRAMGLVDDGQLERAIVEFQRSYDLTNNFAVLYNIGQLFVALAKPVEAVDAYQRYLVGGGKSIPAARRAEVEKEIARQKARIATLVFRILPDGATVRVNGNEIGKTPIAQPLSVAIGEHVVSAAAENHEPAEVKVTVAGEDRRTIELTLKARPEKRAEPTPAAAAGTQPAGGSPSFQPALAASPTPSSNSTLPPSPSVNVLAETSKTEAPRPGEGTYLRAAGIAIGALGVAAVATGVVFSVLTERTKNQVESDGRNGIFDPNKDSRGRSYASWQWVGYSVGAAGIAVGGIIYYLGRKAGRSDSGQSITLVPIAGSGQGGVLVQGAF